MNRLEETFNELERKKEAALIPFIVCGDPDVSTSLAIAHSLVEGGADVLEIGIPFSDPVADGEVIQAAGLRALGSGMNCAGALGYIAKVRGFFKGPIIVMTYCNPPLQFGFEKFCRQAKKAGADGIILTDAPFEESVDVGGLDRIQLIAKNSGPKRAEEILRRSRGFAYLVSFLGTTGSKKPDFAFVQEMAAGAKNHGIPLCAGFGVTLPSEVHRLAGLGCQGVIVGSSICRIIARSGPSMLSDIRSYCAELKKATRTGKAGLV